MEKPPKLLEESKYASSITHPDFVKLETLVISLMQQVDELEQKVTRIANRLTSTGLFSS